jgi:hypothetical protein
MEVYRADTRCPACICLIFLPLFFIPMRYLTISVKLALLLAATAVHAQEAAPATPSQPAEFSCRVLTGRVTDQFAYPLTGATIMLRNPNKGFNADAFSTNAEGHYMVTSKQPIPSNTVMEITAAGYTSQELPLTDCKPLDITLVPLEGTRFKADGRIKKTRLTGRIH